MRHKYGFNELSRTSSERKALLRSQCTSLIMYERITTTLAKAKATQKCVEKIVTRAKNANNEILRLTQSGGEDDNARAKALNVHAHRQVSRYVYTQSAVAKLFNDIAPLFSSRNGGYTRIIKVGYRNNDSAQMAILEFVERTPEKSGEKADKKEKKAKKAMTTKSKDSSTRRNENKVKENKGVSEKVVTRQKKGN